jgi:lipopolysaccharide biosynthesis glycosyltransferase
MNKIVVISNSRFEKGLVAFINSYRRVNMQTPLVIIDTGLENTYPYETIKKTFNGDGLKKAEWMTDYSPYLQLELGMIEADKIIYMEVDMLLLKNIDHLFDGVTDENAIAVMDDAAYATMEGDNYIDNCGRYFAMDSELRNKYSRSKGYNGGLIGGTKEFYANLQNKYVYYLRNYEHQYRLLAQSLLNQYFIEERIFVKDIGLEYNFSGINEYYSKPELYAICYNCINNKLNSIGLFFNKKQISIVHFTGKHKPFIVERESDTLNAMQDVWEFYYNNGELF